MLSSAGPRSIPGAMRASVAQCPTNFSGASSEWHPTQWTDIGEADEDEFEMHGTRFCLPSPLAARAACDASASCCTPRADLFEEASALTTKLFDSAATHGQCSQASLKRWFAWALEQHQAATHQYIASQHSELKAAMEQTFQQAVGDMANTRCPRIGEEPHNSGKMRGSSFQRINSEESHGSDEKRSQTENFVAPNRFSVRGRSFEAISSLGNASTRWARMMLAPSMQASPTDSDEQAPEPCWRFLQHLDCVAVVVVIVNSMCMYLQLDLQGIEIAEKLNKAEPVSDAWRAVGASLHLAEYVFSAFFLVELLVKLAIMRAGYCKDFMNVMDGAVVVVNCASAFMRGSNTDAALARLVRFLKVLRVARMSRIARASNDLRVLIRTLFVSMKSLIWSVVLLGIIILVAGLVMAQLVGAYLLEDCFADDELCEWAYVHYGSATRASWTMFRVTFSGGWSHWADLLIEGISAWYVIFWLVYIVVVWFAVIRIVTALFLKQTMDVASQDNEMQIMENIRTKAKLARKFKDFFSRCDINGDGMVQYHEFTKVLENQTAKAWLQTLGIDAHDVEQLFDLLADGNGAVTIDEFLEGAVRLRGTARSMDQYVVIHSLNKLTASMVRMQESFARKK